MTKFKIMFIYWFSTTNDGFHLNLTISLREQTSILLVAIGVRDENLCQIQKFHLNKLLIIYYFLNKLL